MIRNITTAVQSQKRSGVDFLHPLINAPMLPTAINAESGMKKSSHGELIRSTN